MDVDLQERTVVIQREKIGGLGLSVKGGAEHNLPVLISRIFKDQAADKTGQLFVGDAILKVRALLDPSVDYKWITCSSYRVIIIIMLHNR